MPVKKPYEANKQGIIKCLILLKQIKPIPGSRDWDSINKEAKVIESLPDGFLKTWLSRRFMKRLYK